MAPEKLHVDSILEPGTGDSVWKLVDPYAHLSNDKTLELYNSELKPAAQKLRNSQQSPDTAFYQALTQLWPAWYGTTWDFNGYTHKPRKGMIACGYFVSTTLRDAGMKLNRYDLAKLYSHAICTNICGDSVQDFFDISEMVEHIESRPNDIYIVGLDNHVGFLQKQGKNVFFVHSNYLDPVAVTKEIALESEALNSSRRYVLGSILRNKAILVKWRNGQEIFIDTK